MWAAPEQLMGTSCSTKSDIYALGTVLWELSTGERPTNRFMRAIKVPSEAPAQVVQVIGDCHCLEPEGRPTAMEVHDALLAALQPSHAQR